MARNQSGIGSRSVVLTCLLALGCLGDVDVPPRPPVLAPVQSPTSRSQQTLSGTKPRATAVLNAGVTVVPLDDSESFSFDLALRDGENLIDLQTEKASGKRSVAHTTATVVFEREFPEEPSLAPVASPTRSLRQGLSGGRPAHTAVELLAMSGPPGAPRSATATTEVAPAGPDAAWRCDDCLQLPDSDGVYYFAVVARDGRGKRSEPVEFEVRLDRAAPALKVRYPPPGETDVPLNALVSVGLSEPLSLPSGGQPDASALLLRDSGGRSPSGAVTYAPLAASLVRIQGDLGPGAYTVDLGASLADPAGNAMAPVPSWSFTVGTTRLDAPPPAPTVNPAGVGPNGRTTARRAELAGTRGSSSTSWTAVVLRANGVETEVVPLSQGTTWSCSWPLRLGANDLEVFSSGPTGVRSPPVALPTITRDPVKPSTPRLKSPPPPTATQPTLLLEGTRDADTTVLLNGVAVVPRTGAGTEWVYNVDLNPGPNELELRARSADGTLSDPALHTVEYAQHYLGKVKQGSRLIVTLALRDLSEVQPVRNFFTRGANRYGLDVWLEKVGTGACQLEGAPTFERRGIQYLATLKHFVGSSNVSNPFTMANYRAPDYIAALVTGGVFATAGVPTTADRRGATGAQGGDLFDATGTRFTDPRVIDKNIDGMTEATLGAGLKTVTWSPLAWAPSDPSPTPALQRIDQGEYLVNVLISLDRDDGWVPANDAETCWGSASDLSRGQHRLVRRMSLGDKGYSIHVGPTAESSGPDEEWGGDGQLRYLAPQGATFTWEVPP